MLRKLSLMLATMAMTALPVAIATTSADASTYKYFYFGEKYSSFIFWPVVPPSASDEQVTPYDETMFLKVSFHLDELLPPGTVGNARCEAFEPSCFLRFGSGSNEVVTEVKKLCINDGQYSFNFDNPEKSNSPPLITEGTVCSTGGCSIDVSVKTDESGDVAGGATLVLFLRQQDSWFIDSNTAGSDLVENSFEYPDPIDDFDNSTRVALASARSGASGEWDATAVPLPAGLPLLLVGLGSFEAMRRYKNKAKAV